MMEELKQLKKPSTAEKFCTPPPTVSAPTPGGQNPKKNADGNPTPRALKDLQERPPPVTEGAKLNRFRRLCEVKPSGRCNVPTEVHERWKKSTKEEKEAMIEELERVSWDKDSS